MGEGGLVRVWGGVGGRGGWSTLGLGCLWVDGQLPGLGKGVGKGRTE